SAAPTCSRPAPTTSSSSRSSPRCSARPACGSSSPAAARRPPSPSSTMTSRSPQSAARAPSAAAPRAPAPPPPPPPTPAAPRFRPDMILLDVLMPGIDGYRCAEMLRADPAIGMAPIMFLSARSNTADKVRAFRSGAEDYMVKPFDADELLARVGKALDRQARELGASPTTQLPGADAIQAEIDRPLPICDTTPVPCYLALHNLTAFNDYYGYAKANAVIRQTGDVIRHVVTHSGGPGDFIGHIAGDDFVFITSIDHADEVCRGICERFDHLIRLYYDPADRAHGFIETKDRFGVQRRFPIMSVSIAGITIARAKSYAALAELAAVGKRAAKDIPGSTYVRDGQTLLSAEAATG